MDQKTRRLITARAVRSVAQGALVVDFVLYLRALSWPASVIGAPLATAMVFSVVLTLTLGRLSDRLGRKRFLLGYEAAQIAAAAIALVISQPSWLALRRSSAATGAAPPVPPAPSAR